jgi:two-component system response regulator AlgR
VHILIVDDEALARSRLQQLLEDIAPHLSTRLSITQASDAMQAIALLQQQRFDVAFLDIHMPGASGLQLAREMNTSPIPPLLVFVTAHAEHALQAFELDAIDYLSKPIRAERLNLTLQKIQRRLQLTEQAEPCAERIVVIQERGRLLRLPLSQVLYFKAELKYLTVCTLQGEHLLDGSLNDLEQQHGDLFLRTHRSVLVAKSAIESLEKHHDGEEGWALRLRGIPNMLPVSRRQLALVRQAIQRPCA